MQSWLEEHYQENTIIIRANNGILFKILKISPQSDGSISIFAPYCVEKKGYVAMPILNYKKRDQRIYYRDLVKDFSIDSDCKMSIHRTGFVQFSGRGIVSGIDNDTGEIKGVGVFSSPLDTPITSGPTFGISLWGLELGFEKATQPKKRETFLIFELKDFFIRDTTDGDTDGFVFEFFIFSKEFQRLIFKKDDGLYITWRFDNYIVPGIIMTMRVIPIENLESFIAVLPCRNKVAFPEDMKFGYALCGPTGRVGPQSEVRAAVTCVYPPLPLSNNKLTSLMYESK